MIEHAESRKWQPVFHVLVSRMLKD